MLKVTELHHFLYLCNTPEKIHYFQITFSQFQQGVISPAYDTAKRVSEIVVILSYCTLLLSLISASVMGGNPIRTFLNAFDCLDTSRVRELILMKYTVSILE